MEKKIALDKAKQAADKAKAPLDAQKKIVKDATDANKSFSLEKETKTAAYGKVARSINGYWDNVNSEYVEGLQQRFYRLTNGIKEGTINEYDGYPSGGGQYWRNMAMAEYELKTKQESLGVLKNLYALAISTDEDFDKAIADAQADYDSKTPDYAPVEEADNAVNACAYSVAESAKKEAEAKQVQINDDIEIYEGMMNGNDEITRLEEAVKTATENVDAAQKAFDEYAALTREEKEAKLNKHYSAWIKNAQAAIANLKIAIEQQQSAIDNIQRLIEAEEEKTAE